jgi:hypothetical protein
MNGFMHTHSPTLTHSQVFLYTNSNSQPKCVFCKMSLHPPLHKPQATLIILALILTTLLWEYYEYCRRIIIDHSQYFLCFVEEKQLLFLLYDLYISASIGTENNHNYN